MLKTSKRIITFILAIIMLVLCFLPKASGDFLLNEQNVYAKSDVITLRVSNWEEYIDLGEWDDEETIELDNGEIIKGVNPMYEDFEKWYYKTYGQKVKVEYSCFGTNEDLYNMLTMGDEYDLVCPSEYLIMKLIAENRLEPFSENFFNENDEKNYYINGVSPYIKDVFEKNQINGEYWNKYAAGYMWGVTGVLYNPEFVTRKEASSWSFFSNPKFKRKITLKDNVRDTYFAVLGEARAEKLLTKEFLEDENYYENLKNVMNDVSVDTVNEVEGMLQNIMGNIYSLETDSGKSDLVSGKVIGGYQWSGDAVYAMDQAEEDGTFLEFAVPEECTNLWFDGWVMLKDGINGDEKKKHAAEAFINYLSRPDNVVRNMYYIGYTSTISGGENDTIFQYVNYCYGAEEDEADIQEYPIGFFFSGDNEDERFIVKAPADQVNRQLASQYPSEAILKRTAIMWYFNDEETKRINQMWINVRCYNIKNTPIWVWVFTAAVFFGIIVLVIKHNNNKRLAKM